MIVEQRNSDLTEGIIWKTLIIFTVPILVGNFFQHLYTTADAVIVGRFTGKEGLAAIDSIFSLLRLPVNLFSGLSAGSSILISQLYGAKKYNDLSKTMHTALVLTFIVGTVLSTIGVLLAPALLVMMGVPSDIFNATLIYARIYFGGMLISLFYNIAGRNFTGNGKCANAVLCIGDFKRNKCYTRHCIYRCVQVGDQRGSFRNRACTIMQCINSFCYTFKKK